MFDTLSSEELEFVKAVERYKAKTGKSFPSWTEVLGILKDLGYKKTAPRKATLPAEPQEVVSSATPESSSS